MATYAISDLHGAYDEFHTLLDRVRFRFDGSDSLYLLGDFGDWGARSMETILFVKRLDEQYEFVHCLMGNHEMMFLYAIEGGIVGDEADDAAVNWLTANRGLVTWNGYTALAPRQQEELHRWLRGLPLSFDVEAGGKLYHLAHAYPYFRDMDYTPEEAARRRVDSVWRRLMLSEDPFASYTGRKKYDVFLCGHTITDFYEQERELQEKRGIVGTVVSGARSVSPGGRNRIFHGKRFIDIDCGAKCMAISEEADDGLLQSVKRALLERSQLAAYCLETGEEFYVGRPPAAVGGILGGAAAPGLQTPPLEQIDAGVPDWAAGAGTPLEWTRVLRPVSDEELPELRFFAQERVADYPDWSAPEIGIPDARLTWLPDFLKGPLSRDDEAAAKGAGG